MMLAMGLVLGLFVAALGSAGAEEHGEQVIGVGAEDATAYFPWVANGSEAFGSGPYQSSITVQNLEPVPSNMHFYVSDEDGGFTLAETRILNPNGSTTLTADELDVPEPGGSVYVTGVASEAVAAGESVCVVTANILGDLLDDADLNGDDIDLDGVGTTDVEVFFDLTADQCAAIDSVDGVNAEYVESLDEAQDEILGRTAGVLKQAEGDSPLTAAQTDAGNNYVDGYTGLHQAQVQSASNEYVLPIVQTNNDWNSMIRLANFGGGTGSPEYTVTIYEEGSSGVLGDSVGSFTGSIGPGEIATYDLSDIVEPGFVGSAYIETAVNTGAIVERVKTVDDMLLLTPSRPVQQDVTTTVAPLIFQDYNFWNTGISAANTGDAAATVNFNYYPPLAGVNLDQRNISPRAMEFVYRPGDQDTGIGSLGAAILTSQQSNAAFVDQVKYFGEDRNVGNALGYPTVPVADHAVAGESLAMPLFQKGSTEAGDTSGIQFFNASSSSNVEFEIRIYNTVGNLVAPTIFQPIDVDLSARDNFTLYAHDLDELPTGFQGSVIATVTGGDGLLGAVSNNVNYAVPGDGSAGFNLVNVPAPPEPAAPELNIDPVEAENQFMLEGDASAGVTNAIEALGLDLDFTDVDGVDNVADWIAEFTDDDGEVDLDAAVAFGIEAGVITEDEGDDILEAAGNISNFHSVEAYVSVGEDVSEDFDFDFEIQVLNEFGTQVAAIGEDDYDVEIEDGVATLTYGFDDAYLSGGLAEGGSDLILITATSEDGETVLEGEATKTWSAYEWVEIEPEPEGTPTPQ